VSTNGGSSFTATAATGLPGTGNVHFKAVAGREGDIWLAGGTGATYGLWHSTNSGASFTRLANVQQADNIGFGKAAPGQTYPALFTIAQIDNVRGVFRSDDGGTTWLRINDDKHQWGNIGQAITGDPRIYGRVYLGTNGRGIQYGDRLGGATQSPTPTASASRTASPSPSASRTASASPSASRSPSASPTPTGGGGGGCRVTYNIPGQWNPNFQGDVTITNLGTAPVNGWTLGWTFANGQQINQIWNAAFTESAAGVVAASNVPFNATIGASGGTVNFGFISSWNQSTNAKPTAFTLNGTACAVG
jgi:hypothetical protein